MKVNTLLAVLLVSTVALAGCMGGDVDADRDDVPDDIEERGALTFVYGMNAVVDLRVTSDPTKKDTDGDGLDDYVELLGRSLSGLLPTDPSNPDTDGDGLSDCQEFPIQTDGDCPLLDGRFQEYDYFAYETDPLRADGDLQGPSRYNNNVLNDGEGYRDETEAGDLLPYYSSIKGDGISDGDEILGYDVVLADGTILEGVTSDPNHVDSDGDGLEDGEEIYIFGTHPMVEDTDGDGCLDGKDPLPSRVETYGFAFDRFHFGTSEHFSGDAALVLILQMADVVFTSPVEGTLAVGRGETVSIDALSVNGVQPASCTLASPNNPWLKIQVLSHHRTDEAEGTNHEAWKTGGLIPIDSWGDSLPDGIGAPGVYWNVREDVYRWAIPDNSYTWTQEDDDEWFEGPVEFTGPDGKIWFEGQVD